MTNLETYRKEQYFNLETFRKNSVGVNAPV